MARQSPAKSRFPVGRAGRKRGAVAGIQRAAVAGSVPFRRERPVLDGNRVAGGRRGVAVEHVYQTIFREEAVSHAGISCMAAQQPY